MENEDKEFDYKGYRVFFISDQTSPSKWKIRIRYFQPEETLKVYLNNPEEEFDTEEEAFEFGTKRAKEIIDRKTSEAEKTLHRIINEGFFD